MKKYYKNILSSNLEELLDLFPENEFKSPYRSTVALINYVEYGEFITQLEIDSDDIEIIYEYEVPVAAGIGNPSCSDLLVLSHNQGIIVEAKRTEGKYETVDQWRNNSGNRELVLLGWLQMINNYIGETINLQQILDVPYQMIHRIASACSLNKKRIRIIYLCFDLDSYMKEYYKKNIDKMQSLIGKKVVINLQEVSIKKKVMQINLEKLWRKGSRDLSKKVKNGTISNLLMDF